MQELISIFFWLIIATVQIALVVAIFTIMKQAKKQTSLLEKQELLLKDIRNHTYLQVLKSVQTIQVKRKIGVIKGGGEEVKTITASQWVKAYGDTDMYTIERVD